MNGLSKILLLLEPAPMLHASARRLGELICGSEYQVRLCDPDIEPSRLIQHLGTRSGHVVALIGPHIAYPLQLARSIRRASPLVHVIFIADTERADVLRRDMAHATVLGTYWSFSRLELPDLALALEQAFRLTSERRRMRSEFERLELRPAPATNARALQGGGAAWRLGSILELSDDGILSVDRRGVIQSWNLGAWRLFGWGERETVGRAVRALGRRWSLLQDDFEVIWGGAPEIHRDLTLERAHGASVEAEVRVGPIRGDGGRITGLTAILKDVSRVREANARVRWLGERQAELQSRIETLAEADARKDDLLSLLARQLRRPVRERRLARLEQLVEDILDLGRITNGVVELQRERMDLRAAVEGAVSNAGPVLREAGQRVDVRLPADPVLVDGDEIRLVQVFAKLLDHAAGRTPDNGHIGLTLAIDPGHARVSVCDEGPGIPPSTLASLFDPQAPIGDESDRPVIGLTIAKRLVELHQGTIEARSVGGGQGGELVVRVPLPVGSAPAPGSIATDAAVMPPSVRGEAAIRHAVPSEPSR